MKLDFDQIPVQKLPEFKQGVGVFNARMFTDTRCRIMQGSLEPGSSIGWHCHDTSCEIIYVLSGKGRMLLRDGEEDLGPGDCHYCPKGHSHSFTNPGQEPLVFFAVVPEQ